MIEITVLNYLNEKLTAPVYMEYPDTKVLPFVVLEKTGGGETNTIKTATIAIRSLAVSLYGAMELNEAVKTAMAECQDEVDSIGSVTLNSDYNYTDISEKRYMYQAVFDIAYKE